MAKREEKSAVDKLKSRLYARGEVGHEIEERAPLSPSDAEAPTAWADSREGISKEKDTIKEPIVVPEPVSTFVPVGFDAPVTITPTPTAAPVAPKHKTPMSFSTKFFLGSVVFFLAALGIAAALFLGGVNTTSPQNIDIQMVAPSLIDGGKEASVEIIVTNRNTTPLQAADLIIDYPDGARDPADPTKSLTHQRISLGTINSGQQIKQTISALFYGAEGTSEVLNARLQYSVSGSNSIFEKPGSTSFTIGSAPVSLTVNGPSTATVGDQFTLDVTVRSNAATPVENVAVEGQYPFGFTTVATQPVLSGGSSIWRLGTLNPGDSKVIHITGTLEAADGDQRVFRFLVGSDSDQTDPHIKVPFLTVPATLTVEKPFINGSISLEGQSGDTISAPAGKSLNGTINWANNLPDAISNLQLTLSINGPAVNSSSITAPQGFYQSNTSSIVWSAQGDSELASVAPGGQGSLQFSFATLPPGAGNTLITNPTVTLKLSVQGTRQGDSGGSPIVSAATMQVNLASVFSLAAQSSRTSGPYQNTGPLPPRAESGTSYTVTWTLKNSANTVANSTATAVLPPYVNFLQGPSDITYDQGSRTVTWTLGDVKAGAGYTSAARQTSFQVMLTPSTSQVGSAPSLTGATTVSGQDRFAQVTVQANADGPTTQTGDVSSGMDIVAPKQ